MVPARQEEGAPRRPRRLNRDQADGRIARLRRGRIPSRTGREDLDRPLDPALRVTTDFPFHKLTLAVGGQDVSWLTVVDFRQQIGSGLVRMGGVAGVGTHSDHRFRGYARRVLEGSLRWMRREGFDTAMLYGIPSFYPKFGYAQAFPGVEFTLAVRDAEKVGPSGFRLVGFSRKRHLQAVLGMYHANNAGRTGPTLRDPAHWVPFRKGASFRSKAACKVALDRKGRPAGYIVFDDEHLTATVIEMGCARPAVLADLLRAAARRALGQRLEHIRLILPEDDAFVEFCKPLGLKEQVHYRPDGGAQVRMINVATALTKLAGELGSRMRGVGGLTIRTNLDDVRLTWRGGKLAVGPPRRGGPVARLPQWALAQLLYGYRSAAALARAAVLKALPAARAALAEMFPPRPHFHYVVDHF